MKAKVIQVGCIGPCYLEPLMDIKLPDQPRISYANVDPKKARIIVESYLKKGDPQAKLAVGYFEEGENGFTIEIPKFFDLPMLKPQVRIVLRNCGFIDPENIDHYMANLGYEGIMKAFDMGPENVIKEIKDAGLRGRGGAGFPTYKKWEICRSSPEKIKYLICNADEGD
ncbi:NADH-quinone oxidoreductase subunit F, partial [bacterium]|nr:NADH-quinone oxidoreductase subunit F [bacterium]